MPDVGRLVGSNAATAQPPRAFYQSLQAEQDLAAGDGTDRDANRGLTKLSSYKRANSRAAFFKMLRPDDSGNASLCNGKPMTDDPLTTACGPMSQPF
jgi:hypothetical protein